MMVAPGPGQFIVETNMVDLTSKQNNIPYDPYRSMEPKKPIELSKLETLFLSSRISDQILGYLLLVWQIVWQTLMIVGKVIAIPVILWFINILWLPLIGPPHPPKFEVYLFALIPTIIQYLIGYVIFNSLREVRQAVIDEAKEKLNEPR